MAVRAENVIPALFLLLMAAMFSPVADLALFQRFRPLSELGVVVGLTKLEAVVSDTPDPDTIPGDRWLVVVHVEHKNRHIETDQRRWSELRVGDRVEVYGWRGFIVQQYQDAKLRIGRTVTPAPPDSDDPPISF